MSRFSGARRGGAGLLLCVWALLLAVVLSHDLHHWLHPDVASLQHHCVAVLVGKSECLTAPPLPSLVVVPHLIFLLPEPSQTHVRSPRDFRLSPSRAPPVPARA
jgi:hypothetical protein